MARAASILMLLLGGAALSCSWTRFDDVSENAPVLLLIKPDAVGYGFGSSIAVGEVDGFYRVFVGASPGRTGGAEFEVGPKQFGSKDAVRAGHCGIGCTLARTAAPMQRAVLEGIDRTLCVAEGLGTAGGNKPLGIQIQCFAAESAYLSAMDLPTGVVVDQPGKQLTLASEDGDYPVLMAGVVGLGGAVGKAWFYAPKSQVPVELDPGVAVGDSYGSALAVVTVGGQRRLAVGEPGANRVYLFDETGAPSGCISKNGVGGFGRTLAAGQVAGGSDHELLVASDKLVHVVDGTALGTSGSCQEVAEVVALACRSTPDLEGCGGSQFGVSLAVADIDRDGDGEVLVGAPGMDVRDESDGGAVFVYDVEPDHPDWLKEARFLSSAEAGDRLGAAIGVVHQPDQDILVAGAPGNGKAAVFFCSKLLPANKRGPRCQ